MPMKTKTYALALGATLTTALAFDMAAPDAAEARCPGERSTRSVEGSVPTTITFRAVGENDETQFKIYWLDYKGRRKLYRHIFAGDTYRQQTFMTHPWLVTAPVPGGGEDCIRIFHPRRGGSTHVLR